MFKKITIILLLVSFTNVYATTSIQQSSIVNDEFNQSIDELNYRLNVDWDQKDLIVFEKILKGFELNMDHLIEKGLTINDILRNTFFKIKDPQIQNDVSEISNILDSKRMSSSEVSAYIVSKLSKTHLKGTSWSRSGLHSAFVVGGIIVVLVLYYHYTGNTDLDFDHDTPPEL